MPPALTAAGMLALGLGVLIRERASRESRAFFTLTLTVVVWQVSFAAMYSAADPAAALRWAKAGYLGVPLIAPALLGFTTSVLRVHRARQWVVGAAWAIGGVFVVVIVGTDLLVPGVRLFSWGYYPRLGWMGAPYLVYFCATLGLVMVEFWRAYRRAEPGLHRTRVRWLMIAFGVAYVAVLDYLAAFGIALFPFGFLPVLLFLAITAWTIRRYRLVDLTPSFAAEQILATMADPLIVVDAGRRIRIVNAAACGVLGRAAEELTGEPVERLTAQASPEAARLRSLCTGPVVRDEEMRWLGHEGTEVEVSVSASPLRDATGAPAGAVLIARDVRERKRAERAIRESEERFRSLIENITDAIVLLDGDGTVRFASASLERVIGRPPAERIGKSAMDFLHPDDQREVRRLLATGLDTAGTTLAGEYRLQHRDGSWRIVEATATNLLHDPAVAGIIVAYHDVTERRLAEAALRESEERLRQSQRMEAVGRLAGGVAHDFNNLLTVINGQARLFLDRLLSPAEEREAMEEVMRAGNRAAALTRQLLAFSRKQVLQPKVLDLNAAIRDMEKMLRRLLGEDLELETELREGRARILADPGQIEQVLLNLAVNARDAMPQGGRLTIRTQELALSAERLPRTGEIQPGPFVLLSVRDTGVGMPKEVQERIFEPFYTTKEQGKGTGLGLSTVYGIVKQSGGWIEVESAPGEGTCFRVFLPRVEREVPLAAEAPREEAAVEARGSETVLVVEDELAVRVLVRRVLQRSGYRVLEAEGGPDALALLDADASPIDLLLTDVVMPDMGGRQLAEAAGRRRAGMRVLFMSGYTDDALGHHGVLEEGVRLLAKPFGPEELLHAVREALASPETFPALRS